MRKLVCFIIVSLVGTASFGIDVKKEIKKSVEKTVKLNIKQRKKLKYWNKDIAEYQRYMKRACGKEVPASVSGPMAAPFLKNNKSASGFCIEAMKGVQDNCASDAEVKEIVVQKITKISCTYNKDPKHLSFKLNGTTLAVSMGINASNINPKSRDWIENNL